MTDPARPVESEQFDSQLSGWHGDGCGLKTGGPLRIEVEHSQKIQSDRKGLFCPCRRPRVCEVCIEIEGVGREEA